MAGRGTSLQPYALLGLPAPRTVTLDDPNLRRAYRTFCASLSLSSDGSTILSEGPGLDGLESEASDITPQARAQLRLLIALYHPNAWQTKRVQRRAEYVDHVDQQRGLF